MTRTTRVFWIALLCWAGGILWLSSLTPQELPAAAFIAWDKVNRVTLTPGRTVVSIPTQRRLHRRPSA